MGKITVIGSLNMDLVINTPKMPVLGETILGNSFLANHGGKGANQAVAIARLNGDVSMIGRVGNDMYGKEIVDNLSKYGINTDNVKFLDNYSTGIAMIVVKDGDNFIIVDSGANWGLSENDIIEVEEVIKDSSILVFQLETPIETVEKAIRIAKKHNVKVLLNPAPARKLSDELLSMVDILTPNESECEEITGLSVNNIEDAKSAVLYLNNKGVRQVVVTLGSKGAVFNSGDKIIHKPVPEVNVIDTTAAGDSFTGAIAVAISQNTDIESAVDYANAVGSLTVTKKGAQASLPDKITVDEFMIRNKFKL